MDPPFLLPEQGLREEDVREAGSRARPSAMAAPVPRCGPSRWRSPDGQMHT